MINTPASRLRNWQWRPLRTWGIRTIGRNSSTWKNSSKSMLPFRRWVKVQNLNSLFHVLTLFCVMLIWLVFPVTFYYWYFHGFSFHFNNVHWMLYISTKKNVIKPEYKGLPDTKTIDGCESLESPRHCHSGGLDPVKCWRVSVKLVSRPFSQANSKIPLPLGLCCQRWTLNNVIMETYIKLQATVRFILKTEMSSK